MGEYSDSKLKAATTLFQKIEAAAAEATHPSTLRILAEAYGLVEGSVTSTSKVEVKSS